MSTSVVQAVVPLHPASPQAQTSPGISYRCLQPKDFEELKAAHADLFPIDYEDNFFIRATHGLDRIWSCAAVSTDAYGSEQLVGFIVAKSVFLHEVDASDRQHMGLLSAVLDHDRVLYIMTLGVIEGHRHRGLASTLIAVACQHAYETRCRAVFLHVITYNTAAMSLYSRQGFGCVAKLRAFYYIATGRTPDPQQQVYDAYLFVLYVGGAAGVPSPWDLVSLAWSPLRLAFNRIHACMPGFCRAELQPRQAPLLNNQAAAGWQDHSSSTNSHLQQLPTSSYLQQPAVQQQQQQQQDVIMQPPEQPWQGHWSAVPSASGNTQRYRGPSLPVRHLHKHHYYHHPYYSDSQQQQQQQQQQWSQAGETLQQQPSHYVQEQEPQHEQQPEQAYTLHQGMHPPQQRMLRWLFNGASRGSSGMPGDPQQRQGTGQQPVSAAVRQQQWQEAAEQHKQG